MKLIRQISGRILLTSMAAAGWIGLIVGLGRSAEVAVADDPHYYLAVADIECNPPNDQDRARFLAEVHYYGKLPNHLYLLDPDLPAVLTQAFLRHPDVTEVVSISVKTNALRVSLRSRN